MEATKKNHGGGESFDFLKLIASTSTERKKQESESVSSTKESEVLGPGAKFTIVDSKDYDFADKTIHYIKMNHVIEKQKIKKTEVEENLRKAEFEFLVIRFDIKNPIHKSPVDSKLLQLKICLQNHQKQRATEEFSQAFSDFIERFGLLFAGGKIVIPDELKKQVMEVLFISDIPA